MEVEYSMLRSLVPITLRRKVTPAMAVSLLRLPLIGLPLSKLIWGKKLYPLRKERDYLIYRYEGRNIKIPYEGFPSLMYVFVDNIYSEEKIRPFPGDTIVDIGAYVGAYSVKAWETYLNHSGKIICIEPCSENLSYLYDNVENIPNIKIIPKAVGDTKRGGTLFTKGVQSGLVPYKGKVEKIEIVEIDTLSNLLEGEKIHFIKINVGPSDILNVILGCKETLLENNIRVSIAVGWYIIHKLEDVKKVQWLLKEWGYSSYIRNISLYAWRD